MNFNQTFKALYDLTKEAAKALKEPLVRQRNIRACDAAIDSATEIALDAEEALNKELDVINKGEVVNYNNVLKHMQTIDDANATADKLKEFKAKFFA